jgi:putative methyltransferase (TIGR04325 family)
MLFRKKPPPLVNPPAPPPPGTVEYQPMPSFEAAHIQAGAGFSERALLNELASSWFYTGEPRLTDVPDFFGPFFTAIAVAYVEAGNRPLRVLDFGGATGRYRDYAAAMFSGRIALEWLVVENEIYAEYGRSRNLPVSFYTSLDDVPGTIDLAIFSGVLQYVRTWQDTLLHPIIAASPHVFITRTPIAEDEQSYLQTAHYTWGSIKHAARVLTPSGISAAMPNHRQFSSVALEQHLGSMGLFGAPAMLWRRFTKAV